MTWKPVSGNIQTSWAKEVSPDYTWNEYPRPQLFRSTGWLNLNGLWEYWVTSIGDHDKRKAQGEILVPFPIESALSGVKRPLNPDELLWYRRSFTIPNSWRGKRILLNFEAVDWQCEVYVNDVWVGKHTGGYIPFSFDITSHLAGGESHNELLVSVWDPTDTHWQQRGKQVLHPNSIWYTAVSGIWQTVWLEPVPETFISNLKITPDLDRTSVRIKLVLDGPTSTSSTVEVKVVDNGVCIAQCNAETAVSELVLAVPNPQLWSPLSPYLYDLEVMAGEDHVSSYFGMRKFSLEGNRLCLNNVPYFQLGPLDQGYWPDGLYTPPSDAAMQQDIELVKHLGFNMLRKHVKVEPRRYYYYCDKLGLIVWQDMPNGGKEVSELTSTLTMVFGSRRKDDDYRYSGRDEVASRQDYRRELQEMVDHLYNAPCIGMWVPFNEGWGQFDATAIASWLAGYDPTRTVDHASGWFDQGGGDCKSLHVYKLKLPNTKPKGRRAVVLSEFGGYSLKFAEHSWDPSVEFGYKTFISPQALTEAYIDLVTSQLKPWVISGLSAAIYTQTTDVEVELNGFITYDRAVEKMDFARIAQVHQDLVGRHIASA